MQLEVLSKHPSGAPRPAPLLFVHGAWHAAWCWDVHFLDFFADHGFEAHAVSLRGHGASEGRARLRWARIADYVADVRATANALRAAPIVIGHSMGGFVVQHYLREWEAPAAILVASAPPKGVLATTLRIARRHPGLFARVNATLSLYPIVETPELAREAFFSRAMPDESVREYWQLLQDESYRGFLDMLALKLPRARPSKTPLLVLGGGADAIFLPGEIEATAAAYGAEMQVFPAIAHDMMLEPGWQEVAQRMLRFLSERGF